MLARCLYVCSWMFGCRCRYPIAFSGLPPQCLCVWSQAKKILYGLYWGRRSKQPKTMHRFTCSPCFMYNSILHDSCKTFDTCICANSVWHSVSTALTISGQRQYFDDSIKALLSAHSYTNMRLQLPKQRQ